MFYHFPTPIIDLIMACISSSLISILWNGMASAPFCPSRGIRQRDPLSPYLFILCLNHLSLSLDQAIHTKQLSPIRVGRRPIGFNHILFADNIFLFAKANIQDCTTLFNLFSHFCEVLGQICSATKSSYSSHGTLLWIASVAFLHSQTCLLSKILANIQACLSLLNENRHRLSNPYWKKFTHVFAPSNLSFSHRRVG